MKSDYIKSKFKLPLLLFSIVFSLMLIFTQKVVIDSKKLQSEGLSSIHVSDVNFVSFTWFDIIKLVAFIIICYFIIYMFYTLILKCTNDLDKTEARKPNIIVFIIILISLLLCWLPCILTYYPGGVFSDTLGSLAMAKHEIGLNNHFPIMYTLSWRVIIDICRGLNLTELSTLFVYTCLQCLGMAISASYLLYSCYKKNYSYTSIFIMWVYFAFFNLVPLYIVSLWKDTPFAIVTLLFSTFLFNMFWNTDSENKLFTYKNCVFYIILGTMFCFLRNNGYYSFIVLSIILILYFSIKKAKKNALKMFILSFTMIFVIYVIRGPIFSSRGYNDEEKAESYGVLIQQIAYVIVKDGKLTESEYNYINTLMGTEAIKEVYNPLLVDPIKWDKRFNTGYLNETSSEFLQTYVKIMLRNPSLAIQGYAFVTEGFWDPTMQTTEGYTGNYMWYSAPYEMNDINTAIFDFSLKNDYEPKYLYSSALFGWTLLFMLTIILCRKKVMFLSLIPSMGIWLTLLLATPLAYSLRYAFPLVLVIPLGFASMISPNNSVKLMDS